jgi:hypothetical protein
MKQTINGQPGLRRSTSLDIDAEKARGDGSCRIIRKLTREKSRGTFSYRNLCHPERRFQGGRYYPDSHFSIAAVTYERATTLILFGLSRESLRVIAVRRQSARGWYFLLFGMRPSKRRGST